MNSISLISIRFDTILSPNVSGASQVIRNIKLMT